MIVGIAFKFGAVPFHMWVPDVYHGAPTAVTLFLSSAPKIASFALAYRLLAEGLGPSTTRAAGMLIVCRVLSMVIGNVVAIAQTNLKRMLAYSAIRTSASSCSASSPAPARATRPRSTTRSLRDHGDRRLRHDHPAVARGLRGGRLADFKGLNARSPWFAAVMLMLMFSMAGVPPFVGFWAKLAVIQAVLDVGLLWLAIVAVAFSVIGAYYYLRIVKLMYFDEPTERRALEGSGAVRFVLSVNGLAVLVLGVYPGLLLALCAAVLP